MINLPQPSNLAKQHSQRVLEHILDIIQTEQGWIDFATFMQQALYAPNLGYYDQNLNKIGATGDFVTAPIISPLFAQCLAHYCHGLAQSLDEYVILEFGAGNGQLATDLLINLDTRQNLPSQYLILEISQDLRQRQQALIHQLPDHLATRVRWLDALPNSPISGLILANEVIDAMPVHRFMQQQDAYYEIGVQAHDGELSLATRSCENEELLQAIETLGLAKTDSPYRSEINLMAPAWIRAISQSLQCGVALIIDYGFTEKEYYHPDRNDGTLMCHYQHHAHANPLYYPGLQDITAHVNFSQLAKEAIACDLNIAGFSSQALFLLAQHITEYAQSSDNIQQIKNSQQVQTLTSPSEMGELFKVLALSKNMLTLPHFSYRDLRAKL